VGRGGGGGWGGGRAVMGRRRTGGAAAVTHLALLGVKMGETAFWDNKKEMFTRNLLAEIPFFLYFYRKVCYNEKNYITL